MVKICDTPYPSNSKYDSYFELYPYPLSDFQKYALESIIEGNHVLVTAHTGSGKTLPAEFAIRHFAAKGKKVIYTSPIKALSNQKFYEFTNKYPEISFGLFTGDIKTNPNADVLIMTTEILMNYLFVQGKTDEEPKKATLDFQMDIQNELACVVFDEVHYINDADRGHVWEKCILMLPPHVQMIMLSATIDNPAGFAKWCERGLSDVQGGKIVYLASTNHRVVPLSHYGFLTTTEGLFKHVKNKDLEKQVRETTNALIPLQDHKGGFQEAGYREIVKLTQLFEHHRMDSKRKHILNQLALFLRDREMLPAIAFVFSRKHVELCASEITIPLLEDDSKVGYNVRRECEQIVRKLPNFQEYLQLPEYNQLVSLLEKGIGIHHSGMIPILREIVELMISKRYIKMLFATESFSIGLDCPIKTAIFTSLTKFDGRGQRFLMSHEYTQMAGRAGRRGIDTVGHVVHCNNLFTVPSLTDYKTILGGVPQKLVSKFHISYGLILNLLKNGQNRDFHLFSQKSMIHNEIVGDAQKQSNVLVDLKCALEKKQASIAYLKTPKSVCEKYIDIEAKVKTAVNKKRKELEREAQNMESENRTLKDDVKQVRELLALEIEIKTQEGYVDYMNDFLTDQTRKICNIMIDDGYIQKCEDDCYELTALGKMASDIAEIHPLCLTKLVPSWNNFDMFSANELVGLFSCFTNIKVPEDMRMSRPDINDNYLRSKIVELIDVYRAFDCREADQDLRTGINYEDALIFDMIELSIKWCRCETETECKYFIQSDVHDKGISIGDFTKAMMKIVTIAKEWMNVFEKMGEISVVHKLNSIEGMVLKYVTTAQSLYV